MKIFISWSKPQSMGLALALRDWLPEVIQSVEPWMSSEDIDKGQRWAAEIGAKLSGADQGVLCVTRENMAEPWLNFEAGAIAKALDDSRVRPVLFGVTPTDLTGPLSQFQATVVNDREDMLKLVESINKGCTAPLSLDRLRRAFDRSWPDLTKQILRLSSLEDNPWPPSSPQRSNEELLGELLEHVRAIHRTVVRPTGPRTPAVQAWPVDKNGVTLQIGEMVQFGKTRMTIRAMVHSGDGWRIELEDRSGQRWSESDSSVLEWVPF
ncbi:TIR domain-containing protein [Actinokineospora guangxiensis]|uniref:TIR domain-containing protein n=1 Tax=Actinokineospora guangxiensis TaxID=1490288 RepID=A0ABW0ER50_9PSEU